MFAPSILGVSSHSFGGLLVVEKENLGRKPPRATGELLIETIGSSSSRQYVLKYKGKAETSYNTMNLYGNNHAKSKFSVTSVRFQDNQGAVTFYSDQVTIDKLKKLYESIEIRSRDQPSGDGDQLNVTQADLWDCISSKGSDPSPLTVIQQPRRLSNSSRSTIAADSNQNANPVGMSIATSNNSTIPAVNNASKADTPEQNGKNGTLLFTDSPVSNSVSKRSLNRSAMQIDSQQFYGAASSSPHLSFTSTLSDTSSRLHLNNPFAICKQSKAPQNKQYSRNESEPYSKNENAACSSGRSLNKENGPQKRQQSDDGVDQDRLWNLNEETEWNAKRVIEPSPKSGGRLTLSDTNRKPSFPFPAQHSNDLVCLTPKLSYNSLNGTQSRGPQLNSSSYFDSVKRPRLNLVNERESEERILADRDRNAAADRARFGFVGLRNLGNSCYLNAVLQALFALPTFASDLRAAAAHWSDVLVRLGIVRSESELGTERDSLVASLDALLAYRDARDNNCKQLAERVARLKSGLRRFRTAQFADGAQKDAQEFLCMLLDGLEREMLSWARAAFQRQRATLDLERDGLLDTLEFAKTRCLCIACSERIPDDALRTTLQRHCFNCIDVRRFNPAESNFSFTIDVRSICASCHLEKCVADENCALLLNVVKLIVPDAEGDSQSQPSFVAASSLLQGGEIRSRNAATRRLQEARRCATLQDLIDWFAVGERVQMDCERCGGRNVLHTRRRRFASLPRILTVVALRYRYDKHGEKLHQRLLVQPFITLARFVDERTVRFPFAKISPPHTLTKPDKEPNFDAAEALRSVTPPRKAHATVTNTQVENQMDRDTKLNDDTSPRQPFGNSPDASMDEEASLVAQQRSLDSDISTSLRDDNCPNPFMLDGENNKQQVQNTAQPTPAISPQPAGINGLSQLDGADAMRHYDANVGNDTLIRTPKKDEEDVQRSETVVIDLDNADDIALDLSDSGCGQHVQSEASKSETTVGADRNTKVEMTQKPRGVSAASACCSYIAEIDRATDLYDSDEAFIEHVIENGESGSLPHTYRLVSVVSHRGSSLNVGHYVSDVCDIGTGKWTRCDDECLSERREEDVLEQAGRDGYIFFYAHQEVVQQLRQRANTQRPK